MTPPASARRHFLFGLGALLAGIPLTARRHRDDPGRYRTLIHYAESQADPAGRRVLRMGRSMVESGEILRGSCWSWLDTVYSRAGFPRSRRRVLFAGALRGPYADLSLLRPGDWIYHINHSYHGIEHSGMFVAWLDRKHHKALMLSYGGEGRRRPGRYRPYDITHTYRIIRPEE
ncbi:hypothetical protein [Nitratifractor sp.]